MASQQTCLQPVLLSCHGSALAHFKVKSAFYCYLLVFKYCISDEIKKLEMVSSELVPSGIQLLSTKDIDAFEFDCQALTTMDDGRIIYAIGARIFCETADRQGWSKLYDSPAGKAVVSLCYKDKSLYFVETLWAAGNLEHAVLIIKNVFNVEKGDKLDVSEIFTFTHYEDEDGSYDPPTLST